MGFLDKLSSTKRPQPGTTVAAASQVRVALLSLNRPSAPYQIVDGASERVDLIAGWKIVDAQWYEIFAKAGLSKVFKISLKLDETNHAVRASDREVLCLMVSRCAELVALCDRLQRAAAIHSVRHGICLHGGVGTRSGVQLPLRHARDQRTDPGGGHELRLDVPRGSLWEALDVITGREARMVDRSARIAANNIKVEDTTRALLERYKARHDLPTIKNIKSAPNKLPSVRGEVVHFWVYPVYELVPQEGVEKRFGGTLFITNARLWFNSDEYTSRGFPPRSVGMSTITHFEVDPYEIREGQPGGQRLKVKTSSNGAQADFWFAMSEPYGDVFLLCLSRLVPVGQRTNESLPTADGERCTPDTRSCPNCGHTVPLGARFCASCGSALRAPEQETTHEDTSQGEAFIGWATGAFPNTVLTRTPTSLMLLFTTDRTVVAKDQAAVMGSRYYTGHVPVDMRGVGSASIEYPREPLPIPDNAATESRRPIH